MENKPDERPDKMIRLTPEQTAQFQMAVKTGIYKELHRKGLLTDAQLKQLISP